MPISLEDRIDQLLAAEFALTRNQIAGRLKVRGADVGRALAQGEGTRYSHDDGSPRLWSLMSTAARSAPSPVGSPATTPGQGAGGSDSGSTNALTGLLVRWPEASGEQLGVVAGVTERQISVEFDDGSVRTFAIEGAPIEPVHLQGQVVRRSTGEAGFVVAGPTGQPPRWKVAFPGASGFNEKSVLESDLRPYIATSPVERMKLGQTAPPKKANLALTARHYELEHRTNDLVSLGQARVDLKPYQVSVVHRVANDYPHRFLLCDEVGLGKTIEAGMILKELRARGHAGRTLIIVPPNLVRQWQFELRTKFNEPFSVLNTATMKYLKNTGHEGNPFAWNGSVIVSSGWITHKPEYGKLAAAVDWDMVILDEAHHARLKKYGNKIETTRLYRLMRDLASPARFSNRALLLLTATPMQLERHELFSLVEMLDPALFPSDKHFEEHQEHVPGLNRLVDDLQRHGFPLPSEPPDETVARVADWLGDDEEVVRKRLDGDQDEIDRLCHELSGQHLLSEVLIRNRKSVVGGFMPRHAHRWEVDLSDEERSALAAVEDYVVNGWDQARRNRDNATGFVMTIFQKLMASSIWALRQSLLGRRERLTGQVAAPVGVDPADEDTEATRLVEAATGPRADSAEVADLDALVTALSSIRVDSKAQVLIENLRTILADDPDRGHDCPSPHSHEKVLIFTEFRETQAYLKGLLEAEGWSVHVFHGQMAPEAKDASVEAFRDGRGPQILISTEAGGEGRNFQFCHMLVNYDLPWNPMRVEQRIGRIDRIGQDHVVQVFNLWVRGTIEERVLDVLERRINVFEQTVGGLDPILGSTEKDLRDILRLRDDQRDRAMAALEERLEQQVRQARVAEEQLRDFIMDTKSFSREIAERVSGQSSPISPEAQEAFIIQLLADVNTWIGPLEGGEREIAFHEPFISDSKEFSAEGTKRRVVFRTDQVRDSEHVEYFAIGHPIVDALLERVLDERYEGNAGTRRMLADDDLPAMSGWLCSYVVAVPGLASVEQLRPIFVHDDGRVDEAAGQELLRRGAGFRPGAEKTIGPEDVPTDDVDAAVASAEGHIAEVAARLQAEIIDESQRRAEREREKIEAFYEYRQRAASDKVAATRQTLKRLEASTSEDERRVIPLWRSNLERAERLVDDLVQERSIRLQQIDERLNPTADWSLVSLIRVEVISAS